LLALVARKEALFRELASGRLTSVPGVLELVRGLRREGFQLAIGSSTIAENIDLVVDHLDIRHEFDALVSGEDVTRGKPDPDIFLLAAQKMALAPWRCVVVEDAVPGVEAGKRAGSSVIAVTTSHPAEELTAADRVVDSFEVLTPADFDDLIVEATRTNEA
jgi:beta-phosphoglucomutase